MGEGEDGAFGDTFSALAAPIARAMVLYGMTIAEATERMKLALVQAALEAAGAEATDSRVSVMTGVHRKDVKRLRAETPLAPKRSALGPAALVLAIWARDERFAGPNGAPMPLARAGSTQTPGFDDLVRAAKVDVPAATLLAHLLDDGAIREGPDGLELVRRTVGLGAGSRLEAFERNLGDHLAAGAENLADPVHFERALHVNRLSDASVAQIQEDARAAADALLTALNDRALALQQSDAGDAGATGRIAVGAFVLGRKTGEDG